MIQVVQRALNVLSHLARAGDQPCVVGAIARATGLNPTTCVRILGTLVSEGYVEQEGRRKGYRLGPMAYALTAHGPYRKDLVVCAEPLVRQLAETARETALVAILHQNTRYTICSAEGTQDVQIRTAAVLRGDVYPTATGRLLLACLDDEARDAFIQNNGLPDAALWPEAHTRSALLNALAAIRSQGSVTTVNAGQVVGLARPIRHADRVVAALGIYLPASRFEGANQEAILRALTAAAEAISARLTNVMGDPR